MRRAGVLMPIFSLPSPYGIGTLGAEARSFADFLAMAGQACWQVLPMGPGGYGYSPYQSFSTFAGNPYFIDLDALADETPLCRIGTPEEAARCVLFLAGEDAAFLTGQVLQPNGGLVI